MLNFKFQVISASESITNLPFLMTFSLPIIYSPTLADGSVCVQYTIPNCFICFHNLMSFPSAENNETSPNRYNLHPPGTSPNLYIQSPPTCIEYQRKLTMSLLSPMTTETLLYTTFISETTIQAGKAGSRWSTRIVMLMLGLLVIRNRPAPWMRMRALSKVTEVGSPYT